MSSKGKVKFAFIYRFQAVEPLPPELSVAYLYHLKIKKLYYQIQKILLNFGVVGVIIWMIIDNYESTLTVNRQENLLSVDTWCYQHQYKNFTSLFYHANECCIRVYSNTQICTCYHKQISSYIWQSPCYQSDARRALSLTLIYL